MIMKLPMRSQVMKDLRYKRDISDDLVTLNDLNQRVNSGGQPFLDQIRVQILDEIVHMMFIVRPILTKDVAFF
jgi:hypothetical protein